MLHNHTRCIKTAICIILCSARMFPTAHFTLSADSHMNYAFSPPHPSSSPARSCSSSERLRPQWQEVMQWRHKIFCSLLPWFSVFLSFLSRCLSFFLFLVFCCLVECFLCFVCFLFLLVVFFSDLCVIIFILFVFFISIFLSWLFLFFSYYLSFICFSRLSFSLDVFFFLVVYIAIYILSGFCLLLIIGSFLCIISFFRGNRNMEENWSLRLSVLIYYHYRYCLFIYSFVILLIFLLMVNQIYLIFTMPSFGISSVILKNNFANGNRIAFCNLANIITRGRLRNNTAL